MVGGEHRPTASQTARRGRTHRRAEHNSGRTRDSVEAPARRRWKGPRVSQVTFFQILLQGGTCDTLGHWGELNGNTRETPG